MKDFTVDNKIYILDDTLRNQIRPDWQIMTTPAKDRLGQGIDITRSSHAVTLAEGMLNEQGKTLVGKTVLEIGCNEGTRSYIMAKYQDTYVHGIDVDEYTVEQSPDMNIWNPNDIQFVSNKFNEMRHNLASKVPEYISRKVTFQTADIATFIKTPLYNVVISWDTLEHILDLPNAFKRMNKCMVTNGVMYHEYNPFFAINGGHSLCTLDFLYGHCRLAKEDFERYIKEYRPQEEKIAINFFNKCLNRATIADIKKQLNDNGFEILSWKGTSSFTDHHAMWKNKIQTEFLPEAEKLYPTVTVDDLFYSSIQFVARKR